MLIDMPSPRGTNNERLYIHSAPGAAYDARGGLGGMTPAQYGRAAAHRLTTGPASRNAERALLLFAARPMTPVVASAA
jgi:hypothetical protein